MISILILIGIINTTLITTIPQFALNQEGFELAANSWKAAGQTMVGLLFFISWGGIILIAIFFCLLVWPEVIIDLSLKKQGMKIVKERQKITVPELAAELHLLQDDLRILARGWIAGGGGSKMNFDLTPPGEFTWIAD